MAVRANVIIAFFGAVSSWVRRNMLDSATFGGRFSRDIVLKELPLRQCAEFWKASRLAHYRLCDNYARFYLKYIAPYLADIKSGRYEFESLSELPGWQTMMGLQFENLVLNRVMDFKDALHLAGAFVRGGARGCRHEDARIHPAEGSAGCHGRGCGL